MADERGPLLKLWGHYSPHFSGSLFFCDAILYIFLVFHKKNIYVIYNSLHFSELLFNVFMNILSRASHNDVAFEPPKMKRRAS